MHPKSQLGLVLLAALLSMGGGHPPRFAEAPRKPATCAGPPDPAGLIGTDWTERDKAGWLRDQQAAMHRCLDGR